MRASWTVAVVGGVLVAIVVAGLFVVRPVPDRVIALLGGPTGVDRVGGIRIEYVPGPNVTEAELAGLGSRLRRVGNAFVLEFPGVEQALLPELRDVLVGGGLRMQEVIEGDFAEQLRADLAGEVRVELDQWMPDEGGATHTDSYLVGPSLDELQAVLQRAPVKPPSGSEIRFERIDPNPGGADLRVMWRSYLLATDVLVGGADIASAVMSYDPNTNRPLVLLDFTEAGAETFCAVTARIVGRKLAVVLGDRVRSAPIINGQICGGRASITMGGSDPIQQEAEAEMLAAVLNQGTVPRGGSIQSATWIAPAAGDEWLGRLVLGLLAGVATTIVLFATLRFVRPSPRTPPAPVAGRFPMRRLLVTLCGPFVLLVASRILLPGVNGVELVHVTQTGDTTLFSVVAIGITPIVSAFLLVELTALVVPRLRWRRHDPRGRVPLSYATAVLAGVLALAQAYFFAAYLEQLSRAGVNIVPSGTRFQLMTMLTLATGTFVLAALAGAITTHGLGNGYGVLLVSSWLLEVCSGVVQELPFPWLDGGYDLAEPWLGRERLFGLLATAVMAAISWRLLRWRVRGDDPRECSMRAPSSTLAPLSDAGGLLIVIATLSAVGLGEELASTHWRLVEIVARAPVQLALVLGFVPVWAWLLARPSLIERVAIQADVTRPAPRTWTRAMLLSAVALGLLAGLARLAALAGPIAAQLADAVQVLVATAVVLDIVDDVRAHRERLVCVGALHQIQRADVIERLLAASDIRCHIAASQLRALFNFFGPWAPALVLVPEADAARARELVDGITTEARASIPRASQIS